MLRAAPAGPDASAPAAAAPAAAPAADVAAGVGIPLLFLPPLPLELREGSRCGGAPAVLGEASRGAAGGKARRLAVACGGEAPACELARKLVAGTQLLSMWGVGLDLGRQKCREDGVPVSANADGVAWPDMCTIQQGQRDRCMKARPTRPSDINIRRRCRRKDKCKPRRTNRRGRRECPCRERLRRPLAHPRAAASSTPSAAFVTMRQLTHPTHLRGAAKAAPGGGVLGGAVEAARVVGPPLLAPARDRPAGFSARSFPQSFRAPPCMLSAASPPWASPTRRRRRRTSAGGRHTARGAAPPRVQTGRWACPRTSSRNRPG